MKRIKNFMGLIVLTIIGLVVMPNAVFAAADSSISCDTHNDKSNHVITVAENPDGTYIANKFDADGDYTGPELNIPKEKFNDETGIILGRVWTIDDKGIYQPHEEKIDFTSLLTGKANWYTLTLSPSLLAASPIKLRLLDGVEVNLPKEEIFNNNMGYKYLGWSLKNSFSDFESVDKITMTADTTVYAIYDPMLSFIPAPVEKKEEKNPQTFDGITTWLVVSLISISGIAGSIIYKRKLNN